jgi:expansin (peptidoglycan-binding protein)
MASPARAVLALLSLACGAAALDLYGQYTGEGTFYGESSGGNCVLRDPVPGVYAGMTPVAMNAPQYAGACGACLVVRGSGEGSGGTPITGEFTAFVADKCPECKFGDIDLAKSGDGRWKVSWQVVPCPGAGTISYKFEGSNNNYIKIQPRGMATPASKVVVGGVGARFTDDNFYVADNGAGFGDPVLVETWTTGGAYYRDNVSGKSGVVSGSGPSGGGGTAAGGGGGLNLVAAVAAGGGGGSTCTEHYGRCAGQEGMPLVEFVGCCDGWECVQHADIVWGKQCRPASG